MIKDFNNITAEDIKNTTNAEIDTFNEEQYSKYAEALRKLSGLTRLINEKTLFNDFVEQLTQLKNTNEHTVIEIKIKNEYDTSDKEGFSSSSHCFVAYYNETENKVIIQNYV